MVRVRNAGKLTGFNQRFVGWDRNQIACQIISEALAATTEKFDNNIKFNRFDAITNHYEVTIKCKSPRGKGAKRGATGRRTISCCWHVWGVFFEELFRLNPNIVIVSMGSRITSQSHVGWRDNDPEPQCDCETTPTDVEFADSGMGESTPIARECDASCRHSHLNNNGVGCTRDCLGDRNPGWERQRHCVTCMHGSRHNTSGHLCTRLNYCLERDEFPYWEGAVPTFRDEPNTSCSECRFVPRRTGARDCPHDHHPVNNCLIDGQHRMFERYVPPPPAPTPSSHPRTERVARVCIVRVTQVTVGRNAHPVDA